MRCEVEGEREERLYKLQRCGCNRCYDEYRRLRERNGFYRGEDRYGYEFKTDLYADVANAMTASSPSLRDHQKLAALAMGYGKSKTQIVQEAMMNTTAAPKPITNPAIKLLVDRLASIISTRDSNASLVEQHKNMVKTYGEKVAAADKEAAALRKALKRLGHTPD